ncbi:unnamed protein product, partial [Allacma fusca]
KSRLLYCGECDNRPLPKSGSQITPQDFPCLASEMQKLQAAKTRK